MMQKIGDTEIEFPPMDEEYLKRQGLNPEQVTLQFFRLLEDRTVGFSGRDMKRLAEEALRGYMRRVVHAERWQAVPMRVCNSILP